MSMQKQTYLGNVSLNTITPTSHPCFGNNLVNLNTVIETLLADGKASKIFNIRVHFRITYVDATYEYFNFGIQPVVVQTAGTFTDTINLGNREISDILDQCIDDEFGFQKIGSLRVSKLIPSGRNVACQGVETSFDIPRNIINLLNKETSTERLQSIILGLVGIAPQSSGNYQCQVLYEITFIEKAKGITIR